MADSGDPEVDIVELLAALRSEPAATARQASTGSDAMIDATFQ
ncbi:MAG: hypothetical protein WB998_02820 [Solirubrobacteraceae bacterium]